MRRRLSGTLFIAAVLLVSGCSESRTADDRQTAPKATASPEEGGPLQLGASGGFAFTPPEDASGQPVVPWSGTTGGILPCTDGPPVTLRDIEPIAATPAPLDAQIVVRQVDNLDEAGSSPIASALGTPPNFAEPYALGRVLAGRFATAFDGLVIENRCERQSSSEGGFTELLVVATSDGGGSWLSGLRVSYEAGGNTYQTELAYDFVNCGDSPILQRTSCASSPE